MNNKKFRGIFGIPVTPFNNDESIDYNSLEKVINFTVENGCNGIVIPVMASEYQTLTDEERKKSSCRTDQSVHRLHQGREHPHWKDYRHCQQVSAAT